MKNRIHKIAFASLMAALVMAGSALRITMPIAIGSTTSFHLGNIMCALAGILLGPAWGAGAAGIGSMLFDLTNPAYVASAPFTFVFFFVMAFVCGKIANAKGKNGLDTKQNIVAATLGAGSYWLLYIGKSVITLVIQGSAFVPAIVATVPKMITSGINVVTAIIFSVLLAVPMNKALQRAGVFKKMDKR